MRLVLMEADNVPFTPLPPSLSAPFYGYLILAMRIKGKWKQMI